jgi:hypothetical protein
MKKPLDDLWVVYDGYDGPGNGRHIVFISGDEEYRSEEALPVLAKIMAVHHGFKCTVLFAVDPESGLIDPGCVSNIPGLHNLDDADLMFMLLRFRELPDPDMKRIIDHTEAGKPVIGLRTSTHAFKYVSNPDSRYAKYSCVDEDFEGGYGRQILGEKWVNHHGKHKVESCRGIIDAGNRSNPILRGVEDIWCPSDVYGITTLTGEPEVLVHGQVLVGMDPEDEPKPDAPTMPVAWTKSYTGERGNPAPVFCTTMGAAADLTNEGLRRLLVNACYWAVGMEDQIPEKSVADIVGDYEPSFFGVGTHKQGMRPSDYAV